MFSKRSSFFISYIYTTSSFTLIVNRKKKKCRASTYLKKLIRLIVRTNFAFKRTNEIAFTIFAISPTQLTFFCTNIFYHFNCIIVKTNVLPFFIIVTLSFNCFLLSLNCFSLPHLVYSISEKFFSYFFFHDIRGATSRPMYKWCFLIPSEDFCKISSRTIASIAHQVALIKVVS